MAKVQTGGLKSLEPLRPTLEHKTRHEATISNVADIVEKDNPFEDGDEKIENIRFDLRADIEKDLELDEEMKEALLEYIHDRNIQRIEEHLPVDSGEAEELAEEVREDNLDKAESGGEEVEMFSYNYVQLPYFCTATISRSTGGQNNSNLYNQLDQLGLAEPLEDDKFQLLNRHGDVVEDPEENIHEVFGDAGTNDEINAALEKYLRDNLIGMVVKFDVNNSNRGEDNEYSVVGDMVKKVEDPEAE